MGKDLHYSILVFFKNRMREHSMVKGFRVIEDDDDYLFEIERVGFLPDVIVHLSDSYVYTVHDYLSKPSVLREGDYILVARPEAKYTGDALSLANRRKIGLGKIGEFMSALSMENVWMYKPKKKRES